MKKFFCLSLRQFMLPSLLIVLALPAAITARAAGPDTSQTIRRLEQDWYSAMKSADTAKMDQIIADDWLDWSPNGARVTKAEELKSLRFRGIVRGMAHSRSRLEEGVSRVARACKARIHRSSVARGRG